MSDKIQYYIVVTPFFPTPESFRGPYVYDQVQAIKRNSNYRVVVFVPTSYKDKRSEYTYGDVSVKLFPVKNTPSYFFNGFYDNKNARSFINSVKSLNIPLEQISYVHCHTSSFGIYGLELRKYSPQIKVLLQHHCRDPYTILNGKLSGWGPNLKYRVLHSYNIISEADLNISVSKIINENLISFPGKSPNEDYGPYISRIQKINNIHLLKAKTKLKSCVLYNGVDITKFYPIGVKNTDKFVIGCIANFIDLKDQITLIKAIESIVNNHLIENVRLLLVGSGPTKKMCNDYVSKHGLSDIISFSSEVDHGQLNEFYNSLDLFVLPSVYEGLGCVFLEAHACGVPFITCKKQGIVEFIEEDELDWWTFDAHDYKHLAELIVKFYKCRRKQILTDKIDIDTHINRFLTRIKAL